MTAPDVLQPSSPEEAVSLFEAGVTVIAGGTIVVPELTSGRLRPERAMLLTGAGLAGISRDGSRDHDRRDDAGLGARVAAGPDRTVRSERRRQSRSARQGTVGGNLCAGEGLEAPRGDLQGAFLAVGATVRSAGAGGETTEPLEDFLPHRQDRLLLDVSFEEPSAGAFAPLTRPHTHDYTALAVSAARGEDGTVRLAASGVPATRSGSRVPRRRRATRSGRRRGPDGRDVRRRRARVCLVPEANPARARPPGAHAAPGGLMKLTVNGVERSFESASADTALARAPRGARDHEPEGRLPAGRLRLLHHPRRRRAAAGMPGRGRRDRRCGDHDARRPRHAGGAVADPDGVPRALRRAVRVLHLRHGARRSRLSGGRRQLPNASRSRRRSPATSAAAPATSRSSTPSRPRQAARSRPRSAGCRRRVTRRRWRFRGHRHEGRRRTTPALRRRRPRHGPHDVRRRHPRARHALGEGAALTRGSRGHHRARPLEGRGDEGRARDHHLEGRARCSSTGTSRPSASRPTSRCSRRTTSATRASPSQSSRRRTRRPRRPPSRRSASSSRRSRRSTTSARRSTRTRRRCTTGATGTRTSKVRWTGVRSARARSTRRSSRRT